eukprot:403346555
MCNSLVSLRHLHLSKVDISLELCFEVLKIYSESNQLQSLTVQVYRQRDIAHLKKQLQDQSLVGLQKETFIELGKMTNLEYLKFSIQLPFSEAINLFAIETLKKLNLLRKLKFDAFAIPGQKQNYQQLGKILGSHLQKLHYIQVPNCVNLKQIIDDLALRRIPTKISQGQKYYTVNQYLEMRKKCPYHFFNILVDLENEQDRISQYFNL